jgi:hypothetical protein
MALQDSKTGCVLKRSTDIISMIVVLTPPLNDTHLFCLPIKVVVFHQPCPRRSQANAKKTADVVRDWDLGVTSQLKVLQNAYEVSVFSIWQEICIRAFSRIWKNFWIKGKLRGKNLGFNRKCQHIPNLLYNRPQNILRLFKSIPSPLISMLKPTVLIQNEHKVTLRTATVSLAVEI